MAQQASCTDNQIKTDSDEVFLDDLPVQNSVAMASFLSSWTIIRRPEDHACDRLQVFRAECWTRMSTPALVNRINNQRLGWSETSKNT